MEETYHEYSLGSSQVAYPGLFSHSVLLKLLFLPSSTQINSLPHTFKTSNSAQSEKLLFQIIIKWHYVHTNDAESHKEAFFTVLMHFITFQNKSLLSNYLALPVAHERGDSFCAQKPLNLLIFPFSRYLPLGNNSAAGTRSASCQHANVRAEKRILQDTGWQVQSN